MASASRKGRHRFLQGVGAGSTSTRSWISSPTTPSITTSRCRSPRARTPSARPSKGCSRAPTGSKFKILHTASTGNVVMNERVDSFEAGGKHVSLPVIGRVRDHRRRQDQSLARLFRPEDVHRPAQEIRLRIRSAVRIELHSEAANDGCSSHPRHHRHRRPYRSRQDRAHQGAHRAGHRPAQGGEGARHLDRSRLRLLHPRPTAPRRRHRRSRPRALHPQYARRRPRHRPGAVHGRRRRRRDAAERGAPRHPPSARRASRHLRHHQGRPRRCRAARRSPRRNRIARRRHHARRLAGHRRFFD